MRGPFWVTKSVRPGGRALLAPLKTATASNFRFYIQLIAFLFCRCKGITNFMPTFLKVFLLSFHIYFFVCYSYFWLFTLSISLRRHYAMRSHSKVLDEQVNVSSIALVLTFNAVILSNEFLRIQYSHSFYCRFDICDTT